VSADEEPQCCADLCERVLAVLQAGEVRGQHLADVAYKSDMTIPVAYQAVSALLAQRRVGVTEEPGHWEHREWIFGTSRYWPRDRPPPAPTRRRRGRR
jgi:hypothetical protein